jgi:hypothetical protein
VPDFRLLPKCLLPDFYTKNASLLPYQKTAPNASKPGFPPFSARFGPVAQKALFKRFFIC